MRLVPSDPDLETVVGRIKDGTLDLQPDFQRGAVWSRPKQRLLVDSILRGWYVPPVHVVRTEEDEQEVLDGQQRLRAIYEFAQGVFPADGDTEPHDPKIADLGGLRYHELPERARRRFNRFTVRVFELVDYGPQEPYELFFRLNQPTTLTEAEKRNAFFGNPRAQIKTLTEQAEAVGMTADRIGFSNARLAYEDVVARFVWTLEAGTLAEKVTAARVTHRYRSTEPFSDELLELSARVLQAVFRLPAFDDDRIRLNKATAHTWLIFAARALATGRSIDDLNGFVEWVEMSRSAVRHSAFSADGAVDPITVSFALLNDRATSRVNDAASVLVRDIALWTLRALTRPEGELVVPAQFLATLRESTEANRVEDSPLASSRIEENLLAVAGDVGWARFR